ncbi:hypothetical protein [Streptomyces sp. SID10853]|uniref:hypothetical protein n=1 Tax=Streptomyces sp. SID10853 TaxID=2706028 RepID=UPI001EF1695B|nr:hypothetical protein [Streptomyces sp. SID10853]
MRRSFGPVRMAEPAVSEAERNLFGGPLHYGMRWAEHEHARRDLVFDRVSLLTQDFQRWPVPRELRLTEGVMLAWFTPDGLHRLRIADTTSDLVRRHAASLPTTQSGPEPEEESPASPHGTVPNIIGVHLYLERPDGSVLLGLHHPNSAFAPSTWHVLAVHWASQLSGSMLSGL